MYTNRRPIRIDIPPIAGKTSVIEENISIYTTAMGPLDPIGLEIILDTFLYSEVKNICKNMDFNCEIEKITKIIPEFNTADAGYYVTFATRDEISNENIPYYIIVSGESKLVSINPYNRRYNAAISDIVYQVLRNLIAGIKIAKINRAYRKNHPLYYASLSYGLLRIIDKRFKNERRQIIYLVRMSHNIYGESMIEVEYKINNMGKQKKKETYQNYGNIPIEHLLDMQYPELIQHFDKIKYDLIAFKGRIKRANKSNKYIGLITSSIINNINNICTL